MSKTKLTKKSVTDALRNHGFTLSPCITKCEAGDMRVYREGGKGYYATINFVGGKLRFNGQVYDSVDTMLEAIEKYNKTLEFSADSYNPDYRVEVVTDMRISEILAKCGYKVAGSGYNGIMNYDTDGVFGVKFPPVSGSHLNLGGTSFIEMYDDGDSDSNKVGKIKSFIGAMYAVNIAYLAEKLADMGALDTVNSVPIKTLNPKTFEVTEEDGIDAIISILTNALSKMKKAKKRTK